MAAWVMDSASEGAAVVHGRTVRSKGTGILGPCAIIVITGTIGISAIETWEVVVCRKVKVGRKAVAIRPSLPT